MKDLGTLQGGRRTPQRPGPGPIPEALVQALELPARDRILGQMAGDHPARATGHGMEIDRIRAYVPGDDVRTIDWNVTARTDVPHVREFVPERQLTTWLVLDQSASMHFGTATRRKADVAEGVAVVVGRLATRRAGRLGVVAFGRGDERVIRPSTGNHGLMGLAVAGKEPAEEGGGQTSPARALRIVAGSRTRSGLVVLVSDLRGPLDWLPDLAEVAGRHSVLVIEVADPREDRLVDVGELTLIDPETGRTVRIDTSDRRLRTAFDSAAAAERESLARELRRLRAAHVRLSTDGPWLPSLIPFLAGRLPTP